VRAAEDLRGGGVDAGGAQELQLVGLALHGLDLWPVGGGLGLLGLNF
jgi:hypothetical protein